MKHKSYVVGEIGPEMVMASATRAAVSMMATGIGHVGGKLIGGLFGRMRVFDYAFQPQHPQLWTSAISRDLEEADMFAAQAWLRQMSSGDYDTVTHYTPALRLLVYCERPQDAAMFKLVWGGDA